MLLSFITSIWVGYGYKPGDAPTVYRYIDWIITFPLMAIQFYLILAAVRKVPDSIFWKLLIASLVMATSLYLGESLFLQSFIAFIIGMIAWIYILFELYSGESSRLLGRSGNRSLVTAFSTMRMIVTIGWAVYPLGYVFGYLTGGVDTSVLNVVYNLADFVNKIAFGIIIWYAAMNNTHLSRR